jgi:hypothetical protein
MHKPSSVVTNVAVSTMVAGNPALAPNMTGTPYVLLTLFWECRGARSYAAPGRR